MKKMCDCSGIKGIKSITLLYFVVFLSTINIIWFLYYNFHSVIIFFTCCLAIYLITKNMIYVLGISLFITDILYLVNKKLKYEGFEDSDEPEDVQDAQKDVQDVEQDIEQDVEEDILEDIQDDLTFKNTKEFIQYDDYEYDESKIDTNVDSSDTNDIDKSDNDYMQDKNIVNKLKKLDPTILNTLQKINSLNIEEINKTINQITNTRPDP